jgi:hypothetical protein
MKTIDKNIKKWIMSIEREIPVSVEQNFLQKLNKTSQLRPASEKRIKPIYKIALTAAASLFLALWIMYPLLKNQPAQPGDEIMVQSPRIKGQAAHTIIFKEKNPELTIVWIEK